MRDPAVRRWSAFHRRVYRLTRGRLGRRLVDNDMLLLTTRGRATGEEHTVPLLYLRDGASLVVIASYGGRPRHPDWYLNLVAHPRVEVQVEGRRGQMLARTARPEERAAWWPRVLTAYDGYRVYQTRTGREIPVVFLDPEETGEPPSPPF
jgi:deazaflavin-dependent oxidoreductase (nitroreductase family)